MAQQIRAAQQKAALSGQAPPAWAIGAKCHALSPLDEVWAEAIVKGISAGGNFVVAFGGREDLEEVRWRRLEWTLSYLILKSSFPIPQGACILCLRYMTSSVFAIRLVPVAISKCCCES